MGDGLGSIGVDGRSGGSSVVAQGPYWTSADVGQGKMAGIGRSKRHSRTGVARVGGDVWLAG